MKILITGGSGFMGTNLVEYYSKRNDEVLNLDIRPPRNMEQTEYWKFNDIRNFETTRKEMQAFCPDFILHMAADTGLKGMTLKEYSTNIDGVKNILAVSQKCDSLKKIIFASTMLVCRAGYMPIHDTDYCPTTIYGESKTKGEEIVRAYKDSPRWTIIRPTSIWGPWFGRTYREFFEMIMAGRYFNFTGKMCKKTYGYIGNVVYQIDELLKACETDGKTFYVGDYEATEIKEWAHEIADEMGKKVHTIPRPFVSAAAKAGDFLGYLGIRFPINSFRLSNMTTDNVIDLSETKKHAPETRYARLEGTRITIQWIKQQQEGT